MATGIVLCDDSDLLKFEPNLEDIWPRKDRRSGEPKRDWRGQIVLASQEIERRLRARNVTAERFELGRVSLRTKDELRDACANLALFYIFVAADTQGDASGFFARKASLYSGRADAMIDGVAQMIDYDVDNDGTISSSETNQPMPSRVIRG